jgi:hypothetical protein
MRYANVLHVRSGHICRWAFFLSLRDAFAFDEADADKVFPG